MESAFLLTWRESVGIEPTSPLAKASAVLKTVRDTSPVLSHKGAMPDFMRICDGPPGESKRTEASLGTDWAQTLPMLRARGAP